MVKENLVEEVIEVKRLDDRKIKIAVVEGRFVSFQYTVCFMKW